MYRYLLQDWVTITGSAIGASTPRSVPRRHVLARRTLGLATQHRPRDVITGKQGIAGIEGGMQNPSQLTNLPDETGYLPPSGNSSVSYGGGFKGGRGRSVVPGSGPTVTPGRGFDPSSGPDLSGLEGDEPDGQWGGRALPNGLIPDPGGDASILVEGTEGYERYGHYGGGINWGTRPFPTRPTAPSPGASRQDQDNYRIDKSVYDEAEADRQRRIYEDSQKSTEDLRKAIEQQPPSKPEPQPPPDPPPKNPTGTPADPDLTGGGGGPIGPRAQAGVSRYVPPDDSPDGSPGPRSRSSILRDRAISRPTTRWARQAPVHDLRQAAICICRRQTIRALGILTLAR